MMLIIYKEAHVSKVSYKKARSFTKAQIYILTYTDENLFSMRLSDFLLKRKTSILILNLKNLVKYQPLKFFSKTVNIPRGLRSKVQGHPDYSHTPLNYE